MSGLVEKVKDVVRSRSKHRQTNSTAFAGARSSGDQDVLTLEDRQDQSSMQESLRGRALGERDVVGGATIGLSALRMNDPGSPAPTSHPPPTGNATQKIENARGQNGVPNGEHQQRRPLSGTMMSPKSPILQRNISGSNAGLDAQCMSPEIVSDRNSSMRRKPLPSMRSDAHSHALNGRLPPGHRHTRNRDIAPDDPSPLVPHCTTRSSASPASPTFSNPNTMGGESLRKDLGLSANFDLNNTEHTQVETTVRPVVTAEKIHIRRTEIITKAIHKDIHIDHYFTYVQPIPVREVLPARHFRLDPTTGTKTEISAPEGYKLPVHLEPCKAEDYSHLRQTTRHYLVDNDHPNGKLESPPWRHGEDTFNMQREQINQNGFRV
jgi:hypothetical protein